jgi:hypothetical protein
MVLTQEQKDQVNNLVNCRDQITNKVLEIENILKAYFPKEFELANQFYLPQIITALYEHKKLLSRGEYSLQNTIDKLLELSRNSEQDTGVKKFF